MRQIGPAQVGTWSVWMSWTEGSASILCDSNDNLLMILVREKRCTVA